MAEDKTKERRSPWSNLVFGWFAPVVDSVQFQIDSGQSPSLEDDEVIPQLPFGCQAEPVSAAFEQLWEDEKRNASRPSLVSCIWRAFRPAFIVAGLLKFVHDCLQFVGPQVLNRLILFLRTPSNKGDGDEEESSSLQDGIRLTLAVSAAQIIMSLAVRHYFFLCYQVGMRIRSSVLLAIYKKSLTIDASYYTSHSTGQITNLMSVDVDRVQGVVTFLHAIWYGPLQISLAMFFLWQQLGPSCLAGVAVIIAAIPLTTVTASWMGRLQGELMTRKDARVQSLQELWGNIKVVKLQAWESSFQERVGGLRDFELDQLLRYLFGQACTWLLWSAVPLCIALFTFAAYVGLAEENLDVASALTALALFSILRFPLFMLPYVINMIVEASVSIKRIEDFLSAPDHVPQMRLTDSVDRAANEPQQFVRIENASFSYDKTSESGSEKYEQVLSSRNESTPLVSSQDASPAYDGLAATSSNDREVSTQKLVLKGIDFECFSGEFVVIVGAVGSGKSSLLKAILGEVVMTEGSAAVGGKIAYFDQEPFIMNDSVKGNILFGSPCDDPERYELALTSCSLRHDLALLPNGDQCEIGEKGITMSGGQKSRIALARVVYHDADISLLDDCLSAVDAHVARDLFQNCILEVLLDKGPESESDESGKKTVILVTNALQYLNHPLVDRIVLMANGSVEETGTFEELTRDPNSRFSRFLEAFNDSKGTTDDKSEIYQDPSERSTANDDLPIIVPSSSETRSKSSINKEDVAKTSALMTDEMAEREIGKVNKDVYFAWADAAGGTWVIPIILFVYVIGEGASVLSNWWLTYWSHSASTDAGSQLHFLAIYALINVSAVITEFMRMIVGLIFGFRASKNLFSKLLVHCLQLPMSFFDTTPIGRVMNRFSKDISTLDEELPSSFKTYVECVFVVMSTIVVIMAVTPLFAVFMLPILYYYRIQQQYFTQCYRELKRIDSVTRSPIYALFGETLDGPCTIRAFGAQSLLLTRMVGLVDKQQHAYYLTQAGLCWLAVRLELIGTMIIFGACMTAIFEKTNRPDGDEVFAGLAGLSISYALAVTQSLNWVVRTGSEFEANLISIERIKQYCRLATESPHENEFDGTMSIGWPDKGGIEFRNSQLRYRPGLPLVLKGLNIAIPAQSKVGVVGRTGAGKSTLMAALMRLVELDGGKIEIDGVDTRKIGLRRLRSSIAVVPQDPVLFSGTIRTNLDPFNSFDEDDLEHALRRVGLSTDESPMTLDDKVNQDGSNFSSGQRQLLVIARALLTKARIIICDEATAAIDAEADSRVQRVLREDFAGSTTLTIAHRLNTIMDSSHILVMADGKAVEFDTPQALLKRGGLFKDLVDKWDEEHRDA